MAAGRANRINVTGYLHGSLGVRMLIGIVTMSSRTVAPACLSWYRRRPPTTTAMNASFNDPPPRRGWRSALHRELDINRKATMARAVCTIGDPGLLIGRAVRYMDAAVDDAPVIVVNGWRMPLAMDRRYRLHPADR